MDNIMLDCHQSINTILGRTLLTILNYNTQTISIHSIETSKISEEEFITSEKVEDYIRTIGLNPSECSWMTSEIVNINY